MKEPETLTEYEDAVRAGVWPASRRVPLDEPFVNANGEIQNLLLGSCQSVATIRSVKGSVRANHLHVTDHHYAYVVSGRVLYFERPAGHAGIPMPAEFGPGEMFFTPPGVEHAMLFPVDTVIVTMARNVRDRAHHEDDVRRVEFVTPEIAREFLK